VKYVKKLKCINCGQSYSLAQDRYLCDKCGDKGLLEVEYNYDSIKNDWSKDKLKASKEAFIWRYNPLLPVKADTAKPSLQVDNTPVYESKALAEELGLKSILFKDDGLNPIGSLKDRASAMAVVKARETDAKTVCCSSTGNAASSLAGNVASMGGKKKAVIFVPERAPIGKVTQLLIYGARVVSVKGSYEEAFNYRLQL